MMAAHQVHMDVSRARHADHLAAAQRSRLAASGLRPKAGPTRVQFRPQRVAAAIASLLLAIAVAGGVAAAVNDTATAPAAPNANSDGPGGGGGGGRNLLE